MFHVCIVYPMETGGDRRGVSHEIIKFSTGTLHYIPKCPHLCSIMHMIYIYIRIYNMILCIYIYPIKSHKKSHTSPINSQRSLVNCFDHRVDRIRQVDLSQAMQNRPACKTAVEESIRTTGTQWDHFPSKVAMGFLPYQRSLVGGDWNHGIL